MYCSKEIMDDREVEICEICGVGVWGHNMFKVIVKNMDEAKEKGDI